MSFNPQTPQSPSQFSPATSSDPSLGSSNSMAVAGSGSTTLPTPAHSVNGSASQPDMNMADDSPHKRKRPLDDIGSDRDHKKVYIDDFKLAIEDLHRDVGPKYLLLHSPHPEALPRTSDDLYDMFDLVSLAAEVAREKPNGEKNALRKTYKGHIKRLGVAGHFDVTKKKEDAPSDFMAMLQVPELEWNVHQVKGREISDGLSDMSLSSLGRALTMAKGPVAKSIWDSSVLGDLAPSNGDTSKLSSAKPTAPNTPLASTPGAMNMNRPKTSFLSAQDPNRPRRNIKKRSYGDSSYEGYGEGYPDDDGGMETGYSTGEGEGGQKRRKKNPGTSSPYPSAMRQQSYGPGMVGA
ncbi:Mediator of RNA polymerase II transcription subunit 19 [Cladobotryum mycophilum]|uniref:Mediator of RNA polymerase II transcription subunit 19 n=1 Tax=Cladobotryum mycophilum TaxID=491253 RepID=A0ABR0SMM2_9HYPO